MNNLNHTSIQESSPPPASPSRRALLGTALATGAAFIAGGPRQVLAQNVRPEEKKLDYSQVVRSPWPQAPYIAWYATSIHRDADMYRHTNIDASGEMSHHIAHPLGIATLNWTYGTNNPYSTGPENWSKACSVESLTRGKDTSFPVTLAGITVDEWVEPHKNRPLNEKWMVDGLRQGKKDNPNCFIAAWVTNPTPAMFEVGRDGTVDLFMIEGYTHLAPNLPPSWGLTWQENLDRCNAFKKAGLLHKTIFGFGHISPAAVSVEDGKTLTTTWLHDYMRRMKDAYPEMPGVAFFPGDFSAPGAYDMVRFVDAVAGELWPAKK